MTNYTQPKLYPETRDMKQSWFVGFRFTNPETGERKQFQFRRDINSFKTKRERINAGNAVCDTIIDMLRDGWNPFNDEIEKDQDYKPVYDLLEDLLSIKKSTLKVKSYRTYTDAKNILQRWLIKKHCKTIMPAAFTHKIARSFADHLLTELNYSGKSFNNMLGFTKTYFNMMIDRDFISENPFKKIKRVPQDIGKNHAFTKLEKKALISAMKKRHLWLYYFISFMYHGFIRRNEIIQLKISDINHESITIRSEISKNRKQESVTITEGLKIDLKEMNLHKYPEDWYIFGHGMRPSPSRYSKGDIITDMHRIFLRELGISKEKTLYSWKHTGVCDYWTILKDPYALMRQLRHHDLSMTMIYLKSLGLTPNEKIMEAKLIL